MENIIDLSKLPIEDVSAIVNIVALNNAGKIIKADADYITTESLLATIEPLVTEEELDDALLEYYTSNEVDDFISDVREVAEQAKTIAENAVDEGELNIKLAEQDQKINEAKTIAEQAKTEASNGVTEGEVDQKISAVTNEINAVSVKADNTENILRYAKDSKLEYENGVIPKFWVGRQYDVVYPERNTIYFILED